jgi:hypothetical protein
MTLPVVVTPSTYTTIPANEVIVPQGSVVLPYIGRLPTGVAYTVNYAAQKPLKRKTLWNAVYKTKRAGAAVATTDLPTFTSATATMYSGGTVSLVGTGFDAALAVNLVSSTGVVTAATSVTRSSATAATFVLPTLANGVYSIQLVNPAGYITAVNAVTVANDPTYTSISPTTGDISDGTVITVTGTLFDPALNIKVVAADTTETTGGSVTRVSATSATFTIPATIAAGTFKLHLINPNGSFTTATAVLTVVA